MSGHYLEVDKINVKYGDIQVLWDASFYADKGEIVALVGSNGAGKSTTVKAVSGLVKISSGSVVFDGQHLEGGNCRKFIDHGIILCPEGRQLFPNMTVYENLETGACSKEAEAKKKAAAKVKVQRPVWKVKARLVKPPRRRQAWLNSYIFMKLALAGGTVRVPSFSTASPLLEYRTSFPSPASILQVTSLSEGFRATIIVSVSPVLL
mgnify:CR=1 FL=1